MLTNIDKKELRKKGLTIFAKLIRTKNVESYQEQETNGTAGKSGGQKHKFTKCLTTLDLTSLGVGSCVGTGMYLVAGMVAKNVAGPGVIISFIIAAMASVFSGACYAEFGVRVPNTTGSAYVYSYVTVGEFIAFVIGWNMILEYLIGTSACACALSACFDALTNNAINHYVGKKIGTFFGRPPDFLAFLITILMMLLTAAGAKKSLVFTNILNFINFAIWVFVMVAGLFYVDTRNWTEHSGFLPYGWSGVFTGAATCFYAFIGFDIIATTGEEAKDAKKSIPLAIISSLAIILIAYVTSSMIITLIIPYEQVDQDSALVEMFGQVGAHKCKFVVAIGALAGLTVSMFGSMFPMPRIIYAMATDGLIFKSLSQILPRTGTPVVATLVSGITAALAALLIKLEVLVEMMSIGTLLAYTLVSTCVLILRYQPHSTNLIELLPQSLRTPLIGSPTNTTATNTTNDPNSGRMNPLFGAKVQPQEINNALVVESNRMSNTMFPSTAPNKITIRRITRNSTESDDSVPGDDSDNSSTKDDEFLVADKTENKYYGTTNNANFGGGGSAAATSPFDSNFVNKKLESFTYMCPSLFPWTEHGTATDESGMFVMKMVGILYILIILFDIIVVCGTHIMNGAIFTLMIIVLAAMIAVLLWISRKPQNKSSLLFKTPGLPFTPAIAITINIYLILKLSILTLVRFIFWMALGFFMYFKYGIKNSQLEEQPDPNRIELRVNETGRTNRLEKSGRAEPVPESQGFDLFGQVWDEPSVETTTTTTTTTTPTSKRSAAESRALMANSRQTTGSLFVDETEFPNWDD